MSIPGKVPDEKCGSSLAASSALTGPMAVVRAVGMTAEDKRAVLASWASDQRAVPDAPCLRLLDDGRRVKIADVLDALKHLDRIAGTSGGTARGDRPFRSGNRPGTGGPGWRGWDDDDPPTPAPASVRPRPPVLEGGVAAVASAA